jgi:hypothetical protein
MTGPFSLRPNETQFQIPTRLFNSTAITVISPVHGSIEMQAGNSPAQTSTLQAGVTSFVREFGGAFLAVKNNSSQTITFRTE